MPPACTAGRTGKGCALADEEAVTRRRRACRGQFLAATAVLAQGGASPQEALRCTHLPACA